MIYRYMKLEQIKNKNHSQISENIRHLETIKFISSASDELFIKYLKMNFLNQNDVYIIINALSDMGLYFLLTDFIEYNQDILVDNFSNVYPTDFTKGQDEKFISRLDKLTNKILEQI